MAVLRLLTPAAVRHPDAFGHLLLALDFHLSPTREAALAWPEQDEAGIAELAEVVRQGYRPHLVLAGGPEGSERPELLAGRTGVDGKPAAYVCERFACKAPVTEAAELRKQLD